MGRRERERIARIQAGQEEPIAKKALDNPILRRAIAFVSRSDIVDKLRKASTTEQIEVLDNVVGQKPSKLHKAIVSKAPKEMDKAIEKFQKQGKAITVDLLCAEIKSTPNFLKMCKHIGLDLAWFENLAKKRMEVHNL